MKRLEKSVFTFLLSGTVICAVILIVVPMAEHLLEKTVRGKIMKTAAGFGLSLNQFQVVGIGLNEAHFRDVEIGKSGIKKLTLPDIHVFYTFSGIQQGRISAVRVAGLTIHAGISRKGDIQIVGLPPLSAFTDNKEENQKDNNYYVHIPNIFLDNALVFLETPYGPLLISANLACRNMENTLFFQADIFPGGGEIHASGRLPLPALDGTVDISWDELAPGRWFQQLARDKSLSFSGTISGKASITLLQGKPDIASIKAWTKGAGITFQDTFITLDAHGSTIISKNLPEQIQLSATVCSLISKDLKIATPTIIQLEGKTLDSLQLSAPEIKVQAPIPLTASLSGLLSNVAISPSLQGRYALRVPPNATLSLFPDLPTASVPVKVTGKFEGSMTGELPEFSLSARISQALTLSLAKGKLDMGSVIATGKCSGNTERTNISANILVKNIIGSHRKVMARGDKVFLQFAGKAEHNGVKFTGGKGAFSNINLDDGIGDKISGISGKVRFAAGSSKNSGTLTAGSIVTPDISFFNLQTEWEKLRTCFSFKGSAGLPVKPLKLAFEGSFDPTRQKNIFLMTFQLPETALPDGTDLSPLVSSLAGFSVTGSVALAGKVTIAKNSPATATAKLDVHDMALTTTDNSMEITDIDSSITFTNMLDMISGPSQLATVGKIIAGPAIFENGEIRFQLLDPDTVSVEFAECSFADGEMTIGSFLLSATKPDMNIGIYCNRLKLTSLLNLAMGTGKAKGEGTVSGYIPLRLVNGNMIFGKGFLQSVPGNPGTIRIAESKNITGGVVLAEEAIKDFTYQWARVNLESLNGNLNLLLQLDGKPNRKLPLIYDEKAGDFIRDPQNRRLVALQGLTLDLKFVDIDINRLMKQQGKVKFTSK